MRQVQHHIGLRQCLLRLFSITAKSDIFRQTCRLQPFNMRVVWSKKQELHVKL